MGSEPTATEKQRHVGAMAGGKYLVKQTISPSALRLRERRLAHIANALQTHWNEH